MAKTTETVKAILELKQVSKIYTLGQQLIPALNKLSLKVCEGDFVVIMGASGSGK